MRACELPLQDQPGSAPDAAEMFAAHLSIVKCVIASVARRHRLSADDTEEFTSVVYVKLIEHDYAILRKFGRRSSLRTYLTTVVQRLLLDHRVTQWGKWRPSARARRGGPTAILLERLTGREGLSLEQAQMMMESVDGAGIDADTVARIYEQLPQRAARQYVSETALCDAVSPAPGTDARIVAAARIRTARRVAGALVTAMECLSPDDRLILRLRFVENFKINEIARRLAVPDRQRPKALYRRLRRVLDQLGEALERSGIDRSDLLDAIGTFDSPTIPRAFGGVPLPQRHRLPRTARPGRSTSACASFAASAESLCHESSRDHPEVLPRPQGRIDSSLRPPE
jgi:RNA polymerase sigma factor (sigma-70 family)